MNKRSVFISYSQRDADLAHSVERALERIGFEAFNPARDLRPGENWRKGIQAAIKRSDAVVMLVASPQTLDSTWMTYEAGMAEALGKRVMILLPNRFSVSELPADIASGQIVNFDPSAPERAAEEVFARLAPA